MNTWTERKKHELDLWRKYKRGEKEALPLLLKSLTPVLSREVSKWAPPTIPRGVLMADAKILTVKALNDFDPTRGVALNTFVTNRLKKLSRTTYKFGPTTYIPEHRQLKIRTFKDVVSMLEARFGREPTIQEIAEELVWSPDDVTKMMRELEPALLSGEYPSQISYSPRNEAERVLRYAYQELTPEEKLVLEHIMGLNGKKECKNLKEISQITGLSYDVVRAASKSMTNKVRRASELFTGK